MMSQRHLASYMDRVLQLLWDGSPQPTGNSTVWCLGREFNGSNDGWDPEFIRDAEARVWLMYRTGIAPIARDPAGPSPLRLSAVLRTGALDPTQFTSDVGWGCMIRTGQSLLANALVLLRLGRSPPPSIESELSVLRLFADQPEAPFSLHRFVEHGALHCGKKPGEWFGPSAVASCIRAIVASEPDMGLGGVYVSDGMDVYEDQVLSILKKGPVLILCGLRLGIASVNPIYYNGLRALLQVPQSVGVAGGRTSASHYFYGFQGDRLFYHDPHEPRPALTREAPAEAYSSVHSRRLRALALSEMDPSMLVGFLVRSDQDLKDWKERLDAFVPDPRHRAILVHPHSLGMAPAHTSSGSGSDPEVDDTEEADGFVICDPGEIPSAGPAASSEMSDAVLLNAGDASLSQECEELVNTPRPGEEESVHVSQTPEPLTGVSLPRDNVPKNAREQPNSNSHENLSSIKQNLESPKPLASTGKSSIGGESV